MGQTERGQTEWGQTERGQTERGQSEWAHGRGQSGDAAQDYRGIEGSHKAVGDGRR